MIKRLADQLFRWYCDPECYDDISGDLEELYNRSGEQTNLFKNVSYLTRVISLCRPSIIRPFHLFTPVPMSIFRNYFKISTRTLWKQKVFSLINITGLALGLASFILISIYVNFEESFDQISPQADETYRVSTVSLLDGKAEMKDAMAPYPIADQLRQEFPNVLRATVTKRMDNIVTKKGDEVRQENYAISGDSAFLAMFPYEVIQGNVNTMLTEPNSVVLTRTKAISYFGNENAIGQTLEFPEEFDAPFKVTGVIQDIPANTHYTFDMILSDRSLIGQDDYENWNYFNYYVYVELSETSTPDGMQVRLDQIMLDQYGEEEHTILELIPLTDIHLHSDFAFEPGLVGNAQVVQLLRLISLLIIGIAVVNYINLTTTRAMTRAKEVGVRKVIGAKKSELTSQFIFEAFIVNIVALVLALIAVELFIPAFNNLIGQPVIDTLIAAHPVWVQIGVIILFGTLLSGIYPAFILTNFEPVQTLKGKLTTSKQGVLTRKGLVVIQFGISLLIIGGALIVNQQINYLSKKDLGINTEAVISLQAPLIENEEEFNYLQSMEKEILKGAYIEGTGFTSNTPGGNGSDINSTTMEVNVEGIDETFRGTSFLQFVNGGFFDVMQTRLIAGRIMNLDNASDSAALIMNRSYTDRLGASPDELVGKTIRFSDHPAVFTIVGVIEDFHRTSLKSSIEPSFYIAAYDPSSMVIRLNAENAEEGIKYLEGVWKAYYPENPFSYEFVDDRYATLYQADQRFANVSAIFSILTVFIALLGLYGLVTFMTTLRTKEVGIRKVLGASVTRLFGLYVMEFVYIILFSALVCAPLTYFIFNEWLLGYAYHIEFPVWTLFLSVALLLILSIAIIGSQLIRLSRINPVDTLKHE